MTSSDTPARLEILRVETAGQRHQRLVEIARLAEAAGYGALLLTDPGQAGPDPIAAIAALAPLTRTIGLIAEVDTSLQHPFGLARRLSAIDQASAGRAGWAPVDNDPERLRDAIRIATGLWESWPADAIVADKEAGLWIDTDRIRPVTVTGRHYSVAAPLDVPRSPQGQPLLLVPRAVADSLAADDLVVVDTLALEDTDVTDWASGSVPVPHTTATAAPTLRARAGLERTSVA